MKATSIGLTVVSPGPVLTEMWERLDNDGKRFAAADLKRFRRLGFLPTLSADKLVDATVDAVERDRRFVRLPLRYNGYPALNNAPVAADRSPAGHLMAFAVARDAAVAELRGELNRIDRFQFEKALAAMMVFSQARRGALEALSAQRR